MNTPQAFDQVHSPQCWAALEHRTTTRNEARKANPDVWAHGCLSLGPAEQPVVVVRVDVDPHPYAGGCIWPANYPRALCRVCHSYAEHPGEPEHEVATLRRRTALIAADAR